MQTRHFLDPTFQHNIVIGKQQLLPIPSLSLCFIIPLFPFIHGQFPYFHRPFFPVPFSMNFTDPPHFLSHLPYILPQLPPFHTYFPVLALSALFQTRVESPFPPETSSTSPPARPRSQKYFPRPRLPVYSIWILVKSFSENYMYHTFVPNLLYRMAIPFPLCKLSIFICNLQ
jgi:hypothetical protein